MRFEVDVQPFASGQAGAVHGRFDEAGADPPMPCVWIDRGVEKKGVGAAVPADLDESDELPDLERTDPGERMFRQPLRPRLHLGRVPTECSGMQDAELSVVNGEAGHELDRHSATLLDRRQAGHGRLDRHRRVIHVSLPACSTEATVGGRVRQLLPWRVYDERRRSSVRTGD